MKKKFNKPKASILIASYNNARYLKKCLDSALGQDYKNKEIIVLDDKSTDKSLTILNSYKNKIRLIIKKRKLGIGGYDQLQSYFEIFKICKGEIIFFLDSDDYFSKNKLSSIMNEFSKRKKINVIYDLPILVFSNFKKKIFLKNSFLNNYWSNIMPTSCIALRRFECNRIFRKVSFKDFPDIWLDFRINIFARYLSKKYFYINKNLTYYRQSETNISSKFKHLSKNWWNRRFQAHKYVKYFFKINNVNYQTNFDFYVTKIINYLI